MATKRAAELKNYKRIFKLIKDLTNACDQRVSPTCPCPECKTTSPANEALKAYVKRFKKREATHARD